MLKEVIERVRKGSPYRYRSSVTGLFVPRWYALLHPRTTIRERVR